MKVIVIDDTLHKRLKVLAVNKGKTLKELVREILEDYLKKAG